MTVDPVRWREVEALFERVVESPADERPAILAAPEHAAIRDEVERLLAHLGGAATAMRGAVAAEARRVIDGSSTALVGTKIGAYELVSLIGEGGMGAVYRAERADAEFDQRVAIKLLRGGFTSAEALARFRDERQILAALQHPGIVRLLDGGTTAAGQPYLVMELVEGQTLAAHLAERAPPVRERLALFRAVCAAVQHAHGHLVVHRDLKPSNILVGMDGAPKLLDFGIAKLLDPAGAREAETRTGGAPLTPEYASPEQARGEAVTVATDVYSLGAVLFELLAGRPPHVLDGKAGALALLVQICDVDPPRASTVAPRAIARDIAGDLDNIVAKALHKDPAGRYASVEQLADDIGRHLDGLPVHAHAATLGYRAGKFARRHRGALAIATLVTAALATATAISIRQARHARDEAARAERKFEQVRTLANAVLFEFDPKLENVVGATQARQLMVTRALEYLDHLTIEAGDNHTLALELALAYIKVGDIQGNFYEPYLGDPAAGLASYHKASAIIARERAAGHDSEETRRVGVTIDLGTGVLEHATAQPKLARDHLVAALHAYDALPPTNEFDRYVFRAYLSLGYIDRQLEAPTVAWMDALDPRLRAWRSSDDTRYALGVTLDFRAETEIALGDPEPACRHMDLARHEFDRLATEHPDDARFVREQSFNQMLGAGCRSGIGNVEIWTSHIDDAAGAETAARAAVAITEVMANDRRDARANALYTTMLIQLASIVAQRDLAAAVAIVDRAIAVYEAMPRDFTASDSDRWFTYCPASEIAARAGQRDRARSFAATGLAAATARAEAADAIEADRMHLAMCRDLVARAEIALGDRPADVAELLDEVVAATTDMIHPTDLSTGARVGLVETLELLATVRPTEACALHARAADVWQRWPGKATPFVARQRAAIHTCP